MTNKEKLDKILCKAFKAEVEQLCDLKFGDSNWDSIGHITMIGELEAEFNISISSDDIMKMGTYDDIAKVLEESYGVDFK